MFHFQNSSFIFFFTTQIVFFIIAMCQFIKLLIIFPFIRKNSDLLTIPKFTYDLEISTLLLNSSLNSVKYGGIRNFMRSFLDLSLFFLRKKKKVRKSSRAFRTFQSAFFSPSVVESFLYPRDLLNLIFFLINLGLGFSTLIIRIIYWI